MDEAANYVCLLTERRKSSDFLWASRYMEPLAPHKLQSKDNYSRNEMIENVLILPKILSIIDSLAESKNVDKSIIIREARGMLEEMASKQHLPTFRWLALIIVKVLKRILQSFRVNIPCVSELKKLQLENTGNIQYVYVPAHRSYLDFILMSYILFNNDMAIPNIASGMDFYRMHIVGELLRKTGAFYMRRSFSTDQLYKEIFKAYVGLLIEHSDRAIEFFIEGTRSRSQKSISPKFGLLAMILESLFFEKVSDIMFIPVSISYDRPLEESLFSYELLGVPKPAETTTGLFKSLSILREHRAHGHVYFHISQPISAKKFMDEIQKVSALATTIKTTTTSLNKLPSDIVKNIGYSIIEAQNRHTIFLPINIIAILFNERIHSHPDEPYTFDKLLQDFCWFKNIIIRSFNSSIYPKVANIEDELFRRSEKDEIKECLNTHKNLLNFDNNNLLILQAAYREMKSNKTINVKGHTLEEKTMKLTVPTINLCIYINPLFAILTRPSIVALSIHFNGISEDQAEEQFIFLRTLLANEFALSDHQDRLMLLNEWKNNFSILLNEKSFYIESGHIFFDQNNYFRSLLVNILTPFVAAVYVTSLVLFEWDNSSEEASETELMKECQKKTEILLFHEDSFICHPYSLSLDLYLSTLNSLANLKTIIPINGKPKIYKDFDRHKLSNIITTLESILSKSRSSGSYLDIISMISHQIDNNLQAKL